MHPVDPVRHLYAVPLEDFVAERKKAAKALRDAGESARAAELAKLPKPTAPAWALNALARERPDVVAAWADVADALREASAAPGPGLREAMAAHREATTRLVGLVRDESRPGGRPLSGPMLDRVRALLQEATADPDRAARLRDGLVVEGGADDGAEPEPAPPRRRAGGNTGAEAAHDEAEARAARERAAREAAARRAELERSAREATERAERLRDAAADRAHAAAEAEARLQDARRALLRAESESEAAEEAAQEARDAAADAAREAEVLRAQLRELDD
jgi:hypothetical protein